MHLEMAEAIQTAVFQQTESENGRLLYKQLQGNWPAFYFGQIAPDFSFLDKIKREETHFYTIPMTEADDPIREMLKAYPQLKESHTLPPAQKLFVAGYLAHLLYDQIWFMRVILPSFWGNEKLGRPAHRNLLHLLLLSSFDFQAHENLPTNAAQMLQTVNPTQWLPFTTDDILCQWRDIVAVQLEAGADIRTAEIFAPRARVDVDSFRNYLNDSTWMTQNVHTILPAPKYKAIQAKTCAASIQLLTDYLLTDTLG